MKKGPVIRRTFLAMLYGWLVCNTAFFAIASFTQWFGPDPAWFLLIFSCLFSSGAISITWLLVVFPLDYWMPNDCILREKPWACGFGTLLGFVMVFLPSRFFIPVDPVSYDWHVLLSSFGAITGLTASFFLSNESPLTDNQCSDKDSPSNTR